MSKFIILNLMGFLLVLFLIFEKHNTKKPNPEIPLQNIPIIIEKINDSNSKIHSIICKEVGFKKIKSELYYQKPNCFLLTVENFLGPQLEVGFNELDFWFWIKDFDSKNIYHCEASKVPETRTKPLLYPEVLVDIIGINEIDIKNFKFYNENNKIIAVGNKCGLDHKIILDQEKIVEQLFYQDGNLILKVEVKSFSDYNGTKIPKKIILNFYQEGICLNLEMDPININKKIKIEMPNDKPIIDLKDI